MDYTYYYGIPEIENEAEYLFSKKFCIICGTEYTPSKFGRKQYTCGDIACWQKYQRRRADGSLVRTCAKRGCSEKFLPRHGLQKFCSQRHADSERIRRFRDKQAGRTQA